MKKTINSKKKFELISFSRDDTSALRKFTDKNKIDYAVIPDADSLIEHTFLLPFGYPTLMLVNKKGEIVFIRSGGSINEDDARKEMEEVKKRVSEELKK